MLFKNVQKYFNDIEVAKLQTRTDNSIINA